MFSCETCELFTELHFFRRTSQVAGFGVNQVIVVIFVLPVKFSQKKKISEVAVDCRISLTKRPPLIKHLSRINIPPRA